MCADREGNKRSSLFRALDIFLYDRSCVYSRGNAAFRGGDAENETWGGGGAREREILRGGGTGRGRRNDERVRVDIECVGRMSRIVRVINALI